VLHWRQKLLQFLEGPVKPTGRLPWPTTALIPLTGTTGRTLTWESYDQYGGSVRQVLAFTRRCWMRQWTLSEMRHCLVYYALDKCWRTKVVDFCSTGCWRHPDDHDRGREEACSRKRSMNPITSSHARVLTEDIFADENKVLMMDASVLSLVNIIFYTL